MNSINGYVVLNKKKCVFDLENYILKIFNDERFNPIPNPVELPEYIMGVTADNYNITIKTNLSGQAIGRYISCAVPIYIVSRANMKDYNINNLQEIYFIGGTLNQVYDPRNIIKNTADFEEIKSGIFKFETKTKKEITYSEPFMFSGNNAEIRYGVFYDSTLSEKDNNLGNINSYISIKFYQEQNIDIIKDAYIIISKLLEILVVQTNITFEKISITGYHDGKINNIGDCFIYSRTKEFVSKSVGKTINLQYLNKKFNAILNALIKDEFSTNFLPENNFKAKFIDYETIKNVCTALEFEYEKSDLKKEKDIETKKLVKYITKCIDEYKKNSNSISDRYFNYISNNISTWSLPAVEKYVQLYESNKAIIDSMCSARYQRKKDIIISENNIGNFVKLRNKITHGDKPQITNEMADFCYIMIILVYSSFLKRIGFTEKEIKNIVDVIF